MPTKFLKFHEIKTNSIVYININDISIIDSDNTKIPGRPVSRIYLKANKDISSFCVNETPEKIFMNCNLDGFIRLHNYKSNSAILVCIEEISLLDSENSDGTSKTTIYMKNLTNIKPFLVNESPDKIIKIIETLGTVEQQNE